MLIHLREGAQSYTDATARRFLALVLEPHRHGDTWEMGQIMNAPHSVTSRVQLCNRHELQPTHPSSVHDIFRHNT